MPRSSPFAVVNPLRLKVMVCALCCTFFPAQITFAGPPADLLAPTRAKLDALQTCLGPNTLLTDLSKGLLTGWPGWRAKAHMPPTLSTTPSPPPPPPPEYLDSLDRDIEACAVASRLKDQDQRRAILDAVMKDLEIKSEDCRRFGMGRRVPVSVRTLRGTVAENGWQVFYKWSCSSLLQPDEVRVPNLTSPATVELPPGVYSIRAEKRKSTLRLETVAAVTVVVGSLASVPLELAIE
jgi:hypothetical protein